MQGQVGGKKGWSMNDGDTVPIPVDNKYSDTQPMPLLKQANVTTEAIRKQGTVGPVWKGHARNAVTQASKDAATHAHRAEPHVCKGVGIGAHSFLKIH